MRAVILASSLGHVAGTVYPLVNSLVIQNEWRLTSIGNLMQLPNNTVALRSWARTRCDMGPLWTINITGLKTDLRCETITLAKKSKRSFSNKYDSESKSIVSRYWICHCPSNYLLCQKGPLKSSSKRFNKHSL